MFSKYSNTRISDNSLTSPVANVSLDLSKESFYPNYEFIEKSDKHRSFISARFEITDDCETSPLSTTLVDCFSSGSECCCSPPPSSSTFNSCANLDPPFQPNFCDSHSKFIMATDVTPTMAMTTCNNEQSPSSITARFGDPLGSPPTVSSGCSDDYYYGPSSGEFSSSANGDSIPIHTPSSSCKNNDYWALISKNDDFELKIEAQENYVCFIGSDLVHRKRQIQSPCNNKDKDDHQAVLIYASGSFHIKDLDSTFGTFVNELRVPSRSFIRLNIDDEIRFGFGPDIYQLKHLPSNPVNFNRSPNVQQKQVDINVDDEKHHRSTPPVTTIKTSFKNDNSNEFFVLGDEHDNNDDDSKQLKQIPSCDQATVPKSAKQSPMNKLFRISIRKNDKKSDPVKRGSKKTTIQTSTSTASSSSSSTSSSSHNKLSPSSFSLMSSSSSSSSQSSTPVTSTPHTQQTSSSSMFMSAMKMMKARFKKKSSSATVSAKDKKESSLFICSGNEDITFIRYHHYKQNHPSIHNQHKIEPCSISAPESPNQSRHHIYHSHTYQNTEFLRKLSDDYPIVSLSGCPFITDEHEYDEVTPELDLENDADDDEVPSCYSDISQKQWTCKSKTSTNVGDSNQHFNHNHRTLSPSTPLQLPQPTSTSLTKTKHSSVMNTAQNIHGDCGLYQKNPHNNHHDIIDADDYNASHECFDVENHTSTHAIATLSNIHHLPHLNSEDRLNNNSSLDSNIVHFEHLLKNLKNNKFESNTSSGNQKDSCETSINLSTILLDDEIHQRTRLHQQEPNESFCQNNVIISSLPPPSLNQETTTMTTIETTVTLGSTSSLLLYTSPKQSSVTSTTSANNNRIHCNDYNAKNRVDYICQNEQERQKDGIVVSDDDGKCRSTLTMLSYSNSVFDEKQQINSTNETLLNFEKRSPLAATTVETTAEKATINETTLKNRNNIERHLNQLNNKSIHKHKHSGKQQLVVVPVDSDSGAVTDADTNDLYDIEDSRRGQRRPSSSSSSSTKITSSFDHYHPTNFLASTSSGRSSLGTSATLANSNNDNEFHLSSLEHDVEFDYQQQHCNNARTQQPQSLPVSLQQPRSRHSIGGMAFVINFDDNENELKTYEKSQYSIKKDEKITRRPSPLFLNNQNNNINCLSDVEQQITNVSQSARNSNTANNNISITTTSMKRLSNVTSIPLNTSPKTNIAYVFDLNDMNEIQKPPIELSNNSRHTQYQSPSLSSSMKKSDTYDKKINKILTNDCLSTMNNDKDNFAKIDHQKNPKNHCSVKIPSSSTEPTTVINEMKKNIEMNSGQILSGIDMIDNDANRHSDATLQQSTSRRNGQLSESAVYLINRMFEHNNNYQQNRHHHHHHRSESMSSHGCYDFSDDVDFDNHHRTDEYFGVQHGHILQADKVDQSAKTLATQTTKTHVKSMNRRSMEYDDDSLSSLNLIKDQSAKSHRSSLHRQNPKSIESDDVVTMIGIDQQVIDTNISVVDDEDELSDTGTYVIDIDELTGEKNRRKSENQNVGNSKKLIQKSPTKKKSAQPKQHFIDDSDEIRIKSYENLGVEIEHDVHCNDGEGGNTEANSDEFGDEEDYDEDEDLQDENDDEDKLEVARKQIDELFSNYEKHKKNSSHYPLKKDATFTRSKRRSSCSEVNSSSTYHDDKSDLSNQMISAQPSAKLFDVIDENIKHSTNIGDKSKKRISSELMSAFKRINSKLEKTARLGKLSLLSPSSTATVVTTTSCTPLAENTNAENRHSTKSVSALSKPPLKCSSAPSTPLLDNRKQSMNNRLHARNSRKSAMPSTITNNDSSSTERLDNNDSRQRARSGSMTSNSSASSSLRFNRAFALRRARLGMDTCGVEISEQSANKAKESQKTTKLISPSSFKRNDGGRFSLRVPSTRIPQNTCNQFTKGSRKPPSSSTTTIASTNKKVLKQPPVSSKIPTIKSHSASSSVCSSIENLTNGLGKGKVNNGHSLASMNHRNQSQRRVIPHSDNEIQFDAECSSCDDCETRPLLHFSRFGRRSLRCMPSSAGSNDNSTPWLKSLANKSINSNAELVFDKRNKAEIQSQPPTQCSYSLFNGSSIQSKHRTSSANSYRSESDSQNYISVIEPSSPSIVDPRTARQMVPPFQVGKRFFSTKPHRMAQFDKDFNTIIHGHHSASANPSPMRQMSADSNLMTHSVTECLLSDRLNIDSKRQETKSNEVPTGSPVISSGINARIFSISPLDSLVISAINQLSSKLRTRMRDFLERERTNHSPGSEARTLIEEILPQVNNVNGPDSSKSNQTRNNYNHDSSNISRDLSNILKNLKKVEQIFDVFSMVVEPYTNDTKIVEIHESDGPIITNISDSDTSGSGDGTNGSVVINNCTSTKTSINRSRRLPFMSPSQKPSANDFIQSPPSPESSSQPRSGFFIEI
ncbi:hypothetical protein DERP_009594 [Dermatophagoides pteronyssinus]|uniref:FHA domain-containing protein n=1 Tax=Dermatophagoides pteronyssinus TaxID=6956 RepID=A0ABQ8JAA7_DERPT|nr:hypothetical protein DERP_009594 [Dermatophagoides pteronyssinus]